MSLYPSMMHPCASMVRIIYWYGCLTGLIIWTLIVPLLLCGMALLNHFLSVSTESASSSSDYALYHPSSIPIPVPATEYILQTQRQGSSLLVDLLQRLGNVVVAVLLNSGNQHYNSPETDHVSNHNLLPSRDDVTDSSAIFSLWWSNTRRISTATRSAAHVLPSLMGADSTLIAAAAGSCTPTVMATITSTTASTTTTTTCTSFSSCGCCPMLTLCISIIGACLYSLALSMVWSAVFRPPPMLRPLPANIQGHQHRHRRSRHRHSTTWQGYQLLWMHLVFMGLPWWSAAASLDDDYMDNNMDDNDADDDDDEDRVRRPRSFTLPSQAFSADMLEQQQRQWEAASAQHRAKQEASRRLHRHEESGSDALSIWHWIRVVMSGTNNDSIQQLVQPGTEVTTSTTDLDTSSTAPTASVVTAPTGAHQTQPNTVSLGMEHANFSTLSTSICCSCGYCCGSDGTIGHDPDNETKSSTSTPGNCGKDGAATTTTKTTIASRCCPICLLDFVPAIDMVCFGPICGHVFHAVCLQPWTWDYQRAHCPVCRQSWLRYIRSSTTALQPTTDLNNNEFG